MTLDELSAFVRVIEHGSVSGAARSLAVPKSTVSRLVSALEAKLAIRLLQRSTRGSALTEEGRVFLNHARRVLAEVDDARASVVAGAGRPRGLLRVSAPATFSARFLAPLLPIFLAREPDVRLLLQLTSRQVDLAEDGFDLAIRVGLPRSSSLMMRRLASNPILLCASPRYLEQRGIPDAPAALTGHDMLLHARLSGDVDLELSCDDRKTLVHLSPRLSSNDPGVLVEAALAGLGIAEAPLVIAHDHLQAGRLIQILPACRLLETAIYALFQSGAGMAPRIRVFLDFLVEALAPTLSTRERTWPTA